MFLPPRQLLFNMIVGMVPFLSRIMSTLVPLCRVFSLF